MSTLERVGSEIDEFAAAGRRKQARVLAIAAIVCVALGVAITAVVLRAGDTSGYSFVGHVGRSYGSATKLFAIFGVAFIALGLVMGFAAFKVRRR